MNYFSILADLINQLETNYKSIFLFLSNEENFSDENFLEEIEEKSQKFKSLGKVINKLIQKSKKFKYEYISQIHYENRKRASKD
jgi:hypothetical protein